MPWDGDDLAGQAEEAQERAQAAAEARKQAKQAAPVTDLARQAELESLRMSRARTLSQLERATNPAHRAMLENALRALDEKIGADATERRT